MSPADHRIEELRAEARFAQQRFDLYRARAYGQRPVDPARLRELEREARTAGERLAHALRTPPSATEPATDVP